MDYVRTSNLDSHYFHTQGRSISEKLSKGLHKYVKVFSCSERYPNVKKEKRKVFVKGLLDSLVRISCSENHLIPCTHTGMVILCMDGMVESCEWI